MTFGTGATPYSCRISPTRGRIPMCPASWSRPKYRFARKFLQYQWPPKTPKGRRFDVELSGDGVYEVGIKRWNADKTLLLERQVYWLLLLDGNEYTIPKWQVLLLVEALRNGTLSA